MNEMSKHFLGAPYREVCCDSHNEGLWNILIDAVAQICQLRRGLGGFVRATWGEVTEIIAAANAYSVTPLTLRTGCEESM